MTLTTPTPQRPWQPSKTDRFETVGVLVASFVLAGLTVEFTGLNGKLGFVVSLFFSLLILNYGFYFQKQGKAAAKDSLLQVFTVMAIVLTLIPIVSIIATVVSKGYKGLHWGILTKDMADKLPADAPRWPQSDGRVKTSAAWLMEHAGVNKGEKLAGAQISSKHVLALTNSGDATADDIIELAKMARAKVFEKFGIKLEAEVQLVGLDLN